MKRLGSVVTVVILLLVSAPSPAQAMQEPVSFSCVETPAVEETEGSAWEVGNVVHARGLNPIWRSRGDALCAGTLLLVYNYDFNLLTGEGHVWGTWHSDLRRFPGSGFEGTFTEHLDATGEVFGIGSTVGTGYGEFDGWRFRSTLTEVYPGYIVEAGLASAPNA